MKTTLLLVLLVSLALAGCGGGSTSTGPNISGHWVGSFTGDISGDLDVRISRGGSLAISGETFGSGPFTGSGTANVSTGVISGTLDGLGSFTGLLRLVDDRLEGTAKFPGGKNVVITLDRS